MKKALIIIVCVIAIITATAVGGFMYLKSKPVPAIDIGQVDLQAVNDGTYAGKYETALVKASVEVDVADHKIKAVRIIRHDCGLGKKAEKITGDIVKAQSLDVDVVSGATQSSQVILKAVENALEKGSE